MHSKFQWTGTSYGGFLRIGGTAQFSLTRYLLLPENKLDWQYSPDADQLIYVESGHVRINHSNTASPQPVNWNDDPGFGRTEDLKLGAFFIVPRTMRFEIYAFEPSWLSVVRGPSNQPDVFPMKGSPCDRSSSSLKASTEPEKPPKHGF